MVIKSYNLIHKTNFEIQDIKDVNNDTVPDCDIIFYSPPCQAFSSAGKQLGFDDPRGILFFEALRIIQAKKPKYAIMENVKGLTTTKFNNEFTLMLSELERAGYVNYISDNQGLLNAKDYTIPQNRERVFVVSIRNDINFNYTYIQSKNDIKPLIDFIERDEFIENITSVKGCSLRTRSYRNQPQKLEIRKDDLCNTITTVPKDYMFAFNLSEVNTEKLDKRYKVIDNYAIRMPTTLEGWTLMGFEKSDLEVLINNKINKTAINKIIGNTIVVNVIEELLKPILEYEAKISSNIN